MAATASELKAQARAILAAEEAEPGPSVDALEALSDSLTRNRDFDLARRLLVAARARPGLDPERDRKLRRKEAVRTYKDPDCGADEALDGALAVLLPSGESLAASDDEETLGIAGAIHKRKWEVDGRVEHLERSLQLYRKGWELPPAGTHWYPGINVAYVLDLLAHLREQEALSTGWPLWDDGRRQAAQEIRGLLVVKLEKEIGGATGIDSSTDPSWWKLATLVEAHFGLGGYREAREWLGRAALTRIPDWELESTVRQLASLERLRPGRAEAPDAQAVAVLEAMAGEEAKDAVAAFGGKLGLALSGGGFRAAFFHLGVLAAFADLDVLRHVEVLSCVSGGSIVGSQYYLELRRLVADPPAAGIGHLDIVGVVQKVQRDMLGAVGANIRQRAVFAAGSLVPPPLRPGRNRTTRVAELLEKHLFSKVDDGPQAAPRPLRDLVVQPPGAPAEFNPKRHNWRRAVKVPVLVVNATTLDTGHNWQFTATWMGEPPSAVEGHVDASSRLDRMWLADEAPLRHRDFGLATAVAASACVPGLFPPVAIEGLYEGMTVHLVDGGLHDNQGVYGLLEQDCRLLFVSDASAQRVSMDREAWNPWSVVMRSNTIAMGSVRKQFYRELASRQSSSRLKALWYVHMAKGLEGRSVPLAGTSPKSNRRRHARRTERRPEVTPYGVPKPVQRRLAALRTDLDFFSDTEADALMLSGYRMASWSLRQSPHPLVRTDLTPGQWRFLRLSGVMSASPPRKEYRRLLRALDAGRHRWFRRVYGALARLRPTPWE